MRKLVRAFPHVPSRWRMRFAIRGLPNQIPGPIPLVKLLPWLVAASAAWSLGFAYNTVYGGGISWLSSMYEKKIALVSHLSGNRRLLLVGGSGMHYTVNSQYLAKKLGFPVFNLGLDGNLGFNVIFPAIIEQIRPGDIVLLVPEYLMLLDEDGIGERSVPFEVATRQMGIGHVPLKQYSQDFFLLGIPGLRSLVKSSVDLVEKGKIEEYYSDPITDQGDPTKTWPRKGKWWTLQIPQPITPHSVQRIRQFRQEVEAKGATLVLSLPWIYGSNDPKTVNNVKITAQKLSKIAPTIYDPVSLNIKTDSNLFADTHYHLQPEARIKRSDEIAAQLQPILKSLNSKQ